MVGTDGPLDYIMFTYKYVPNKHRNLILNIDGKSRNVFYVYLRRYFSFKLP